MIVSVFARYIERIPTFKDLVKRLERDFTFKLDCGFKVSDNIPSEASYSQLLTKLSETDILEKVQETIVLNAISEGLIHDDTVAIDATHFEARDKAPAKQEKPKEEPKKRGRKKKDERQQWLIEQKEQKVNLPLNEKNIEHNWTNRSTGFGLKFHETPNGVSRKTVKGRMCFGSTIKDI